MFRWHFHCVTLTLTLTQWPWYSNVSQMWSRCATIPKCIFMSIASKVIALTHIHSDIDRQTERQRPRQYENITQEITICLFLRTSSSKVSYLKVGLNATYFLEHASFLESRRQIHICLTCFISLKLYLLFLHYSFELLCHLWQKYILSPQHLWAFMKYQSSSNFHRKIQSVLRGQWL